MSPTPSSASQEGGARADRFLGHLEKLVPGMEPRFQRVGSADADSSGVFAITYPDIPESGFLTTFTYGLSLGDNPAWQAGKPELCITVRSADERWGLAAAHLAAQMRGSCPFSYGDTIDFGEPITPNSRMTGFVVFAPAVLDRTDYLGIHVDDGLPININGLYPVYDEERAWIRDHGLREFWELDWDMYDVQRPPAVPA